MIKKVNTLQVLVLYYSGLTFKSLICGGIFEERVKEYESYHRNRSGSFGIKQMTAKAMPCYILATSSLFWQDLKLTIKVEHDTTYL